MKKSHITLIAATMIILVMSTHKGYSTSTDITEKIKRTVNNTVSFPEFAKDDVEPAIVTVNYSLEADGTLTINNLNSSDKRYSDYLIKKLNSIKIKDLHNKSVDEEIVGKFIFRSLKSEN